MKRVVGASCMLVGASLAYDCYKDLIFKDGKSDLSSLHLRKEKDNHTSSMYDYIVCGSGPGAAAWLRTTLKAKPDARILLLERGPYCKTDILTESNPIRCFIDSIRIVADYNHGVMQVIFAMFIRVQVILSLLDRHY